MRPVLLIMLCVVAMASGRAVASVDGTTPAHPDDRYAAAIAEGRSALRALVETGRSPGVSVAVAREGRVVWAEGFGLADLEHSVPVSVATRFGIGSISKALTMAAAVRLWERGALDLDAPIEHYLPDFAHKGRQVTVRRIAVHQSGISDAFASEHYDTTRHFPTLDAAYREIQARPLQFEPGTQTAYATGLFTIVGRVMEAVTGKDYLSVMREQVFDPAGIAIVPNDRRTLIPHRTGFYENREGGGFRNGAYFDPSHKLPGAGFLATATELAQFGAALLDGTVLGERGRREMFRPVPLVDGTSTEYALGIRYRQTPQGRVMHVPGGGIGISSWLFIHEQQAMVIALVANVNTAPVGGRAYQRIAEAFGR